MRLWAKQLAIAHSAHPTNANIVKKVQFTTRRTNKKHKQGQTCSRQVLLLYLHAITETINTND
ncbi:MAG: hypothetical protein ACFN4S_09925, partial [Prevotella conceptionensis]